MNDELRKSLVEGVVPYVPGTEEPAGLWAVIAFTEPGPDHLPEFLVKGPSSQPFGGPYWYPLDGEYGWTWDQVMTWPGTVRLVRPGVAS